MANLLKLIIENHGSLFFIATINFDVQDFLTTLQFISILYILESNSSEFKNILALLLSTFFIQ